MSDATDKTIALNVALMPSESSADPRATKGLDGTPVTRVARGVDVLAQLHQQIQQVLVGLGDAWQPKPNV